MVGNPNDPNDDWQKLGQFGGGVQYTSHPMIKAPKTFMDGITFLFWLAGQENHGSPRIFYTSLDKTI